MKRTDTLSKPRAGQVSILLVLAVSLVAGTFAMTATRRVMQHRRAIQRQDWITAMESALESVQSSKIDYEDGLRIPFAEDREQWIVIGPAVDRAEEPQVLVRLIQRETTLAQIVLSTTLRSTGSGMGLMST